MISILYCKNIVHPSPVGIGCSYLTLPVIVYVDYTNNDNLSGNCYAGHYTANMVKDIDEPVYDGSNDFITADGTHVHSDEEWKCYLKKYIP